MKTIIDNTAYERPMIYMALINNRSLVCTSPETTVDDPDVQPGEDINC